MEIAAFSASEGNMSKPFVHFFETPKGKYFYDVNSNAIVRVTSKLYECLNNRRAGYPSDNSDILKELETLTGAGMLSTDRWEEIEHPATQLLKEHLDGSLFLQFRYPYTHYYAFYYNSYQNMDNICIVNCTAA